MVEIINVFKDIAENYGEPVAVVLLILVLLGYTIYWLVNNFSSVIVKYLEKKVKQDDEKHTKATLYRKSIMPEIRKILSNLAQETSADRAVLFEFSNGTSNLVGLPFLYLSATCEVVKPNVQQISHLYQKTNSTLVAEFLEKLEEKGYFFISDIEEIKLTHPVLYNFMVPNGVKCALFYALYGIQDTIGFVVISTVNNHCFYREDSLPRIAESAQLISSHLNYDKIQSELE